MRLGRFAVALAALCTLILAQTTSAIKDEKCKLTRELEEGPFYLASALLLRSNITEGEPGVALTLRVLVEDPDCQPLPGTIIDVWSANSTGFYSGYAQQLGPPGNCTTPEGKPCKPPGPPFHPPHKGGHPPHLQPDSNTTFLRGLALTGMDGIGVVHTIIPGWYPGRCLHVHVKVHAPSANVTHSSQLGNSHVVHTGQFFFPESLADQLEDMEPYRQNEIKRTKNAEDHDYRQDPTATLKMTLADSRRLDAGATGEINIVIDQFRAESAPATVDNVAIA